MSSTYEAIQAGQKNEEDRALYAVRCSVFFILEEAYSFFKEMPPLDLEAFFSFCISFFCLFDLGAAFCTFFCSLFATKRTSCFR